MTPYKFYTAFVLLTLGVINVAAQSLQPCKVTDEACILKSAKAGYTLIAAGIPSLGVEPSDPLFVDVIKGDLSTLKFTFTNTTILGYKNCYIESFKLKPEVAGAVLDLVCPKLDQRGDYEISGSLIVLPVEGKGDFTIVSGKYLINVDLDFKKSRGKDGKEHLGIKNFTTKLQATEKIEFQFANLFNGQKALSDTVHKFANENWKEVADFVQGPVFNKEIKTMVSRFNKYLKTVPYEDMFLQ